MSDPVVAHYAPGRLPPALWALVPAALGFRGMAFRHADQPALASMEPRGALWLALDGEDLVLLGPYGAAEAFAPLVAAARRTALETGRARLLASVRNDEIDRFECLQRLGFTLMEARLGVLSAGEDERGDEGRTWGDIAARDELIFALPVRPH